jgi:flagellar protein FlaG
MSIQAIPFPLSLAVAQQQELQKKKQTTPMEQEANQVELPAGLNTPDLKKTASDLEQISLAFNRRLKFIIDQESREIIIKVIDNETDKVIKVLPPEELQRLHSRIRKTMGFLFDRIV